MAEKGFDGLRVLALENRRSTEIAALIRNYGGVPTVVPVMREVPLESNEEAFSFAKALMAGQFDLVLFLTGAGTKILFSAVLTRFPREQFVAALRQTKIAVRGPKPVAALREFGIAADIVSQEPSTWREVLDSVDSACPEGIASLRVAVQEYGAVNTSLLEGLAQRGAQVTRVPVYQWALSDNLDEIRATVGAVLGGEFEVLLFLTGIQATHFCQVARDMGQLEPLLQSLKRIVVVCIGPSTAEALTLLGITPDFQPSHPKMGITVREAANVAVRLIKGKRGG
jgi:uroporphyrinogen-III synthase